LNVRDRFGLLGNTVASTFRVDSVVAEGGFGVVYRAFHLHFRSPVALKCLKIPEELPEAERQRFLEQFRSEAEIMFRLSSRLPNIVRPLHVDAVNTPRGQFVPLMALEWLEGQSLEKLMEQRTFSGESPLPLEELYPLLTPVAHALEQAHHFELGGDTLTIVHRDIKPDNLFLCTDGGEKVVKILDFGISKVRRAASQMAGHVSRTSGQAPFSPAYGAPEQWLPKRFGQTGPWTDVWGLALTMVEVLKGDAVITGDHQAMMGTALDAKVRPTPRSEGVSVSDSVDSVFRKALAVDPRYRYQTVRSFWEALGAALEAAPGNETPSQHRVRLQKKTALPVMLAPTPWTPPRADSVGSGLPGLPLPPLLAPAQVAPSLPEELEVDASYPNDPASGLAPVPPAPVSGYLDEDLFIPSLSQTEDDGLPILDPDDDSEPPLLLELDETTLPPPPEIALELAVDLSDEPEPLTLVPSRGTSRRP